MEEIKLFSFQAVKYVIFLYFSKRLALATLHFTDDKLADATVVTLSDL
jgi:hypothetical protein